MLETTRGVYYHKPHGQGEFVVRVAKCLVPDVFTTLFRDVIQMRAWYSDISLLEHLFWVLVTTWDVLSGQLLESGSNSVADFLDL